MGCNMCGCKKRICLIYTGGTIGMVPSPNGYTPKAGFFRRMLEEMPEMYDPDMPSWSLLEFDPLLDSSNITVREWNKIGRAIAERYRDFDGFIVLDRKSVV